MNDNQTKLSALSTNNSQSIVGCRSCGHAELLPVLDLGSTPLANRLIEAEHIDAPEPTYPLEVVYCPNCTMVQITETVDPEELFGHYLYFSSFSQSVLRNAEDVVGQVIKRFGLGSQSLATEIASNDGYLLQYYKQAGVPVLGIEPAANVAEVAEKERGVRTVNAFFGQETAERLVSEGYRADVIHANNVLAHVADTNGVVAGFFTLLNDHGVVVVEAPYLRDTIEGVQFDQVYHEHLCYFSLHSLDKLFRSHGLTIFDVQHLPIHGGSLRIFARRDPAGDMEVGSAVSSMLAEEQALGMTDYAYYRDFGQRVTQLKNDLTALLKSFKDQSKRLAVYGASAKGATLLNYYGIGAETFDWVADVSTVKQGKYTPGTHLPIVGPERLLSDQPDAVLLLSWNFRDEILSQQAEYVSRGGKFIIPIPKLEVV